MNRALTVVDRLGLFSVILVFWAVFVVFAQGFLSPITTFGLSRSIAITTVIGLAQMIVLSIGQMNLAIGAIGGMVGVATGWMMQVLGLPIWVAIVLGLLLGAAVGWLNGLLITQTGINSFIVTLGMGSVITGLVFILTKAEAFRDLPPAYTAFGKYRLVEIEWLAALAALYHRPGGDRSDLSPLPWHGQRQADACHRRQRARRPSLWCASSGGCAGDSRPLRVPGRDGRDHAHLPPRLRLAERR